MSLLQKYKKVLNCDRLYFTFRKKITIFVVSILKCCNFDRIKVNSTLLKRYPFLNYFL